jgi:hypothetical protein
MAIYLSSSQSSTLEPLRKNRWVMQFTNVPPGVIANAPERLTFCALTATKPQMTFNAVEQHRLNERFWVAGKVSWNDLAMTFYDFIQGQDTVSNILWNWATTIYNPITGQMFFKTQYMTSATLAMLDPAGGVVQMWNLFYVWPMDINYGDLSASDDAVCEVSATFKYDYSVKGTDVDTSPRS